MDKNMTGEQDPEAGGDVVDAEPKDREPNEQRGGPRQHGRSFIYLSLPDADEALRKIDHHAKRMSREGFARALGHPKPKGRFLQKLDALQDYKLATVDSEDVTLTELAVEMLYGASEEARARARTRAFLSYDLFNRTFVECPKNQDYELSYLAGFATAKLNIVNDVETYIRRFLESAKFAGLLEGEANPKAQTVRLRPALVASDDGARRKEGEAKASEDQWVRVSPGEEASLLDGLGLTQYQGRCAITQKSSGDIAVNMADGKITIEVRRPLRVAITPTNMLADVTEIIKALQSKGFKA
jgi:hypothetical protein